MPGYNNDSHNLEDVRIREEDDLQNMIRPRETATSPSHMDQEKRIRREIANSNERRRMQSINAGFQSLRSLLPHHEGEKLSKAAILQQTAEYIYQLEQEKTSLLSQNCHLKRLLNQHEGGGSGTTSSATNISKKRKIESHHQSIQQAPQDPLAISTTECTDEGIGPLSPEPGTTSSSGGGGSQFSVPVALISPMSPTPSAVESDLIELRLQLDRERRMRMRLEEEKQLRSLEQQLYPERLRDITQQVQLHYQHPENSDVNDLSLTQESTSTVAQLQVVSACNLPPVAQTQTIVATSPLRQASPSPPPPIPVQSISPGASSPIHSLQVDHHIPSTTRLPSALEAAIKAEPKVEVERLPSPSSAGEEVTPQTRLYLASTSRQNLETIVEAIRHLEGDHLFADESAVGQDAPLALTKPRSSEPQPTKQQVAHRLLKVEMNPFFQLAGSSEPGHSTSSHNHVQQQQQQRPGVIVVQQHT